ncbi:unnamed protein product [Discosporangium mesarthrocarpum]
MIVCFAVIGRQNEPLFLRTYMDNDVDDPEDSALRLHNVVHSSLDIFNEWKGGSGQGKAGLVGDMFLGHLCPIDEYRVYGYVTSTWLKLVAVLEDSNSIREAELRKVFSTVHNFYVNYLRNPFSPLARPIVSERFQLAVDRQVNDYNAG